jgi:hypothetical protein
MAIGRGGKVSLRSSYESGCPPLLILNWLRLYIGINFAVAHGGKLVVLIFPRRQSLNKVTLMDSRTRCAHSSTWPAVLVFVSALVAAAAYAGVPVAGTGEAAAAPQNLTRIESHLSQLEQRVYSIESSIRSLEQQSRLSGATAGRSARDPEVGLLRTEVGALRLRLAEVECGLAKLDERTLTAAAREARRKSEVAASDPCRLNADAPLRLPSRP